LTHEFQAEADLVREPPEGTEAGLNSLNVSEEWFRRIAERSTDVIFTLNNEGIITYISPAIETVSEYTPKEVIGKNFRDLVSDFMLPEIERVTEVLKTGKKNEVMRFNMKGKEGSHKRVEVTALPIIENEKIIGFQGTLRDITERIGRKEDPQNAGEHWRNLFELAPDSIIITDLKGAISEFNHATTRLTGYSDEELKGKNFASMTSLAEQELFRLFFTFALSSQQDYPKPFVIPFNRKDGSMAWVEAHTCLVEEHETPVGIQIFLRDITDRKKAEEELLFKNALLEAQYETSPSGILVVDKDDRVILYNERFRDLWGLQKKALKSKSRIQLLIGLLDKMEDPNEFLEKIEHLKENERKKSREEIKLKNGRILDRYSSPLVDSEEQHHGRIWFFRDITEEKLFEEKLEMLHEHALELSKAETIIEVAESTLGAIEKTLGFRHGRFCILHEENLEFICLKGEKTRRLQIPLEEDQILSEVVRTGQTHYIPTIEGREAVFDLVERDFEPQSVLAIPVKMNGNIVSILTLESEELDAFSENDRRLLETLAQHVSSSVTIIHNRRELEKNLKELERSNKELDDYTYVVSHDLKAPLRSITAFSDFILEDYLDKLDDQGQEYLNRIRDASLRMDSFIQDLLVLSRVGRKYTDWELVDLKELMETIKLDFEATLEEKNGKIFVEGLPTIMTQKVWMKQLFSNLISNGLKFNESQTPTIKIDYEKLAGHIQFNVTDNGIGIREEDQDKIFRLFERLHTKDEYEGTGAGLAICKKIVESLGGSIWVESKIGEGTTFRFTHPLQKDKEA
jgi:PAS domain S-box-containing protein